LPTLAKESPSALWAADGVSCTLCHQIQARNLGKAESFTAGFVIDTQKSLGQRPVFGPFTVDSGRTRVMQSAGRLIPTRASTCKRPAFAAPAIPCTPTHADRMKRSSGNCSNRCLIWNGGTAAIQIIKAVNRVTCRQ
ncbi:MAG: hypothetical protein R6U38_11270, partial [Desulfatiglandaceae bacterium]